MHALCLELPIAQSGPSASALRPLAFTPPSGQIWRSYYYAGAQLIAMRVLPPGNNTGTLYYLHADHLGSTSVVTCGNTGGCGAVGYQGVVAQQWYHPYGSVRASSGGLPTDITFTGHRSDASTGLMYFRARYYSGALGRFIQADTIVPGAGSPQALNRYAYSFSNPLKYTDPLGHEPCETGEGFYCTGGTRNQTRTPPEPPWWEQWWWEAQEWFYPQPQVAPIGVGPVVVPAPFSEPLVANATATPSQARATATPQPQRAIQTQVQNKATATATTTASPTPDEWTFVGYHGTSSWDAANLVGTGNVMLVPASATNFGNGQLGPGFYTSPSPEAAALFAANRVGERIARGLDGGVPTVLSVYGRGNALTAPTIVDPQDYWGIGLTSPYMNYPVLTAPISGYEYWSQLKYNPVTFPNLKVDYASP